MQYNAKNLFSVKVLLSKEKKSPRIIKRSSLPYLTLPYLPVIYFSHSHTLPPYLTLQYLTIPKNVLFTDITKNLKASGLAQSGISDRPTDRPTAAISRPAKIKKFFPLSLLSLSLLRLIYRDRL